MFGLDKFCDTREAITKADFLRDYPDRIAEHKAQVAKGDFTVTRNAEGQKMWYNPNYTVPDYAIDSMHMGGPTRFINHSCDPNCAIYTVSYNHADEKIYELAFFAMQEIPAYEELTFNYKDDEDTEIITDAKADELEEKNGERPTKCLCGSDNCRNYFFSASS